MMVSSPVHFGWVLQVPKSHEFAKLNWAVTNLKNDEAFQASVKKHGYALDDIKERRRYPENFSLAGQSFFVFDSPSKKDTDATDFSRSYNEIINQFAPSNAPHPVNLNTLQRLRGQRREALTRLRTQTVQQARQGKRLFVLDTVPYTVPDQACGYRMQLPSNA